MIAAATNRASTAGRRWAPALAGLGIVVLGVTACGSSGTTATPTAAPAAAASTPKPTSSAAAFPGVTGTAAAVSGSSLEVQNPTSGQVTDTVSVTAKDVTVGSCVTVVGKPSTTGSAASSVTATTVTISAPVKGDCTGAGGFGGGGFGGTRPSGAPRPSFSARPRPTGSQGAFGNGAFGGADGKVLSVSATGFVVQARSRTAGAAGSTGSAATVRSVTVITNSASKYLKTVSAAPAALKVGQCITAVGATNSIGAIAAQSIRISQPGPTGCVTGFSGRGGFGRPTTNA